MPCVCHVLAALCPLPTQQQQACGMPCSSRVSCSALQSTAAARCSPGVFSPQTGSLYPMAELAKGNLGLSRDAGGLLPLGAPLGRHGGHMPLICAWGRGGMCTGLCIMRRCLWICKGCHMPATAWWAEALGQRVVHIWHPIQVQKHLGVGVLLPLYTSQGRHAGHVPSQICVGQRQAARCTLGSAPCCCCCLLTCGTPSAYRALAECLCLPGSDRQMASHAAPEAAGCREAPATLRTPGQTWGAHASQICVQGGGRLHTAVLGSAPRGGASRPAQDAIYLPPLGRQRHSASTQ